MQQVLEEAITAVTGQDVRIEGSGRTDAGAHALGQVLAFSSESSLPSETLRRAINVHLPYDVVLVHADDAPIDFHPRHDARARTYRYLIWNRPTRSPLWQGRALHIRVPLDEHAMNDAAQLIVGKHDFSSFVPIHQVGHRVRSVFRAGCIREGDLVSIEIEGNGFMRQMVRSIAGTLVRVGIGRMAVSDVGDILESRTRTEAADTAAAHGLYLVDVRYAPATTSGKNINGGVEARRIEETV